MKMIFAVTGIALLLASIMCLFPVTLASAHAASSVSHARYTITYGKSVFVKGSMSAVVYGCNSLSCDGLDPHTTRCDQSSLLLRPITVRDNQGVVATGNNVYSIGCNANWTRASSMAARAIGVWLTGYGVDSTGKTYNVCFPGDDGYYGCSGAGVYAGESGWPAWTDMIEGTHLYTACIYTNYGSYQSCASQ
jgi:hypothetical protein